MSLHSSTLSYIALGGCLRRIVSQTCIVVISSWEQKAFPKSSGLKDRPMSLMMVIVRISGGLKVSCLSLLFLSDERCQEAHPKEFHSGPQGGDLCVKFCSASMRSPILMSVQFWLGVYGCLLVSRRSLVSLPGLGAQSLNICN